LFTEDSEEPITNGDSFTLGPHGPRYTSDLQRGRLSPASHSAATDFKPPAVQHCNREQGQRFPGTLTRELQKLKQRHCRRMCKKACSVSTEQDNGSENPDSLSSCVTDFQQNHNNY